MQDESISCKTSNQQYLPETLLIALHKVAKIISQFVMPQSCAVLRSDTLTRKEVNYAHGPMVLRVAFVQRPIIANPGRWILIQVPVSLVQKRIFGSVWLVILQDPKSTSTFEVIFYLIMRENYLHDFTGYEKNYILSSTTTK